MLLIKWECQYYPRRKYCLLFSPRWCRLVCGCAPSARALLGLEEFGGAGSGVFWDVLGLQGVLRCFMFVGLAVCCPQMCCSHTAAAGRAHSRRNISSLWAAQGSCQVFPQLPAGAGDLCYPAAVLFPAELIISLALECRMTIFTLQDSQY